MHFIAAATCLVREGTNVEHNASVTKLLTTQGIRDSNESTNADAENTIAMETLKQLKTLIIRKEKSPETPLIQEERDLLASLVERGLDILDLMPEGDAESAPPQETRPADGSSSKSPLDMEDGSRNISMRSPQAVNPIRVCPDLSNSGFALSFLFSRREAGCGGKVNDPQTKNQIRRSIITFEVRPQTRE